MSKIKISVLGFLIISLIIGYFTFNKLPVKEGKLIKISEIKLDLLETSGLDFSFDNKSLWTVCDQNGTVYNISLTGKTIKQFTVKARDLEGICVISENEICLALEETGELLFVDTTGVEFKRIKINIKNEFNKGIEGVTYDSKHGDFFIVTENKPRRLIKLDKNFDIVESVNIDYVSDISGIKFDSINNCLWLLSDESKMVVQCDLLGNPIKKYKFDITQAEGITLDKEINNLYIISDPLNTLYKFKVK